MVVIRGRLTPEVGAVVRRALEAALDEDRRAAASREPGEPDPVHPPRKWSLQETLYGSVSILIDNCTNHSTR